MKKLFYATALCMVFSTGAFAQKANVKAAEKIAKSDKPNFEEARGLIKSARENAETKADPYTWYVSGLVENQEFEKELIKDMMPNGQGDKTKMYSSLLRVFPFYKTADSLDRVPNDKGKVKPKYEKDIMKDLKSDHLHLINAGAHFMNEKKYDKATEAFDQFLAIKKLPMFAEDNTMTAVDSNAMIAGFYGAVSAYQSKNYDKAISIANAAKDLDYQKNEIYQLLADSYLKKGDSVSYRKVLEEGMKIFPKESYYTLNMTNSFIQNKEYDKAIEFLNNAIAQDPKNAQLYDVMGKLYEQKEDYKKAAEFFQKSIDADPEYAEGYFDLGRTYYNEGVTLKSGEKMDAATEAKAKEWFQKSLPMLEKAYRTMPKETYYILGNVYYNLGMNDKQKEIMDANK